NVGRRAAAAWARRPTAAEKFPSPDTGWGMRVRGLAGGAVSHVRIQTQGPPNGGIQLADSLSGQRRRRMLYLRERIRSLEPPEESFLASTMHTRHLVPVAPVVVVGEGLNCLGVIRSLAEAGLRVIAATTTRRCVVGCTRHAQVEHLP